MKTFCVVQDDGKSYLVKAVSVYEVSETFHEHSNAIGLAIAHRRPHSYRYGIRNFITRFEEYLPITVAPGVVLQKVRM